MKSELEDRWLISLTMFLIIVSGLGVWKTVELLDLASQWLSQHIDITFQYIP